MRNYIFEFEQEHAIMLGLTLSELLLLDYFFDFFREGRAVTTLVGGQNYFLIRYSKILADLPILGSSERTMMRMIGELERKQVLKRHVKGNRDLYIRVDWRKLANQE